MLRHLVPLALALAFGSGTTCNSESANTPPDTKHGEVVTEAQCMDKWLEDNRYDQYGNKAGTMYAGGTPLFDEATGKTTDRMEYIYQNHPEARTACHK
ncbi:MAG TPA: hypothetical protein VFA20_02145 [Myxococcaceae bacterium]|nr:hypothetical protein [Myxococcaceae bacterium]